MQGPSLVAPRSAEGYTAVHSSDVASANGGNIVRQTLQRKRQRRTIVCHPRVTRICLSYTCTTLTNLLDKFCLSTMQGGIQDSNWKQHTAVRNHTKEEQIHFNEDNCAWPRAEEQTLTSWVPTWGSHFQNQQQVSLFVEPLPTTHEFQVQNETDQVITWCVMAPCTSRLQFLHQTTAHCLPLCALSS